MDHIKNNALKIKEKLTLLEQKTQRKITCIVASKYGTSEELSILYKEGFREFGENKIQDGLKKIEDLKEKNITWHFIGHLQSNKIRKAIESFEYIQSIDSLKTAQKTNNIGKELDKKIKILVQLNIGEEIAKSGFTLSSLKEEIHQIMSLHYLKIQGIMIVAPFFEDKEKIRPLYKRAAEFFLQAQKAYPSMTILSMGMSDDYEVAIEEGATMVRIGREFFKK